MSLNRHQRSRRLKETSAPARKPDGLTGMAAFMHEVEVHGLGALVRQVEPQMRRRRAPSPPAAPPAQTEPEPTTAEAPPAPSERVPHWTEEYCQWRQRTAEDDAEDAEEEAAQRALDDDPLGLYRDY